MEPPSVDMAGALALATAQGVAPEIAAVLLPACARGIDDGLAERRAKA